MRDGKAGTGMCRIAPLCASAESPAAWRHLQIGSAAAADSDAYAAAEAGSRPVRPGQVAADRHGQFVTQTL